MFNQKPLYKLTIPNQTEHSGAGTVSISRKLRDELVDKNRKRKRKIGCLQSTKAQKLHKESEIETDLREKELETTKKEKKKKI